MKKYILLGAFVLSAGCTLQQFEDKLKEVQPTVDTVAATGVAGPYGLAASWVVSGILGLLNLRQKRGMDVVKGAFGVASRALDAATKGEAGEFVAAEIAKAPKVSTTVMKDLHEKARDGNI
jgi:hypothetical protein